MTATEPLAAGAPAAPLLIDTNAVAKLLGVCARTVTRAAQDDPSFPRPVRVGVRVLFHSGAVAKWVDARAGVTAAAA